MDHPLKFSHFEVVYHMVLAPTRKAFDDFVFKAPEHPRIKYVFINEAIRMEGWQHCYTTITFLHNYHEHPEWPAIKTNLKRTGLDAMIL